MTTLTSQIGVTTPSFNTLLDNTYSLLTKAA